MAWDYMMRDIHRCLGELLQIHAWLHLGRLRAFHKNKPRLLGLAEKTSSLCSLAFCVHKVWDWVGSFRH